MKTYLIICAVIYLMMYLNFKVMSEKVKREGYVKRNKSTIAEKLLGWITLVVFSLIPLWNVLYLYVLITKGEEMYYKIVESEDYINIHKTDES